MDPWAIAGFFALGVVQLLGLACMFFIARQGKGENKQQAQGETIASLGTRISSLHESRDKEMNALRQETQATTAASDRRFSEMESRLERHLIQVDTRLDSKRKEIDDLRNGLSRLETIVENLAKTVERLVERDERSRVSPPPSDAGVDMALLRAFAALTRMGVDLGKTPAPSR